MVRRTISIPYYLVFILSCGSSLSDRSLEEERRHWPTTHFNEFYFPPHLDSHIQANTSTSRRTQAAIMAYMKPSCITNCNSTAIDFCSLTTAKRSIKLEFYMNKVIVPPCFTILAAKYVDKLNNNIALVCDGGIDNYIPLSPPF